MMQWTENWKAIQPAFAVTQYTEKNKTYHSKISVQKGKKGQGQRVAAGKKVERPIYFIQDTIYITQDYARTI